MDRDLDYMMHELDRDGDGSITFDELSYGMSKWLKEVLAQNLGGKKNRLHHLKLAHLRFFFLVIQSDSRRR